MQLFFYILCFFFLLIIIIQDIRSRAISWILIPALFFSALVKVASEEEIETIQSAILSNSIFLVFQISILIIYFSIKTKKVNWVIDQYIGLGDVLFLFAISPIFCLGNYILFIVSTLFLTIILYMILKTVKKNTNPQIPLAGIQAIFLMAWLVIEISFDKSISHTYLFNYFDY